MLSYFSRIDPNLVAAVIALVLGIVYHHLSPATQAKISDSSASTLSEVAKTLDLVMSAMRIATTPGTTVPQLEAALWQAAKPQLAHVGFDVDKMPPAITELVQALIAKWTANLPTVPLLTPMANPVAVVTIAEAGSLAHMAQQATARVIVTAPTNPVTSGTSEAETPPLGVPTPNKPA